MTLPWVLEKRLVQFRKFLDGRGGRTGLVYPTEEENCLPTTPMPSLRHLRGWRYSYHYERGHTWRGLYHVGDYKIDGRVRKWELGSYYGYSVDIGLPPDWWFPHHPDGLGCFQPMRGAYAGWWTLSYGRWGRRENQDLNTIIFAVESYLKLAHDGYERNRNAEAQKPDPQAKQGSGRTDASNRKTT